MTDQRPIDPSTLRDGDYVRAEGDGWAAEGYYYRREIRSKAGWNVVCLSGEPDERVTILRPVLVKGDRVTLNGEIGTYRGDIGGDTAVVHFERNGGQWNGYWPKTEITRLPAAPEPAPIEVGDWWKSATGIVGVVLGVDGDTLTWRRLDGSLPLAGRTHVMAESWTRLDGPPEPAVGKVYVLTSFVCENIAGHHYRMGISGCHPWSEFLRCFTRQELATLQIVHTLGVE